MDTRVNDIVPQLQMKEDEWQGLAEDTAKVLVQLARAGKLDSCLRCAGNYILHDDGDDLVAKKIAQQLFQSSSQLDEMLKEAGL